MFTPVFWLVFILFLFFSIYEHYRNKHQNQLDIFNAVGMPGGSQKFFLEFLQNLFKYSFFIKSTQEINNGFAGEPLWFLGHSVESTLFRHKQIS